MLQLLSFLSNDGWTQMEKFPVIDAGDSKPPAYHDYTFYLREFDEGIAKPLQGQTTGIQISRSLSNS